MPEFDGAALEAKYARLGGRPFSDPERDAFAVVERLALRFSLADRVLISLPMWNFGVPYKLKQWFDLIVQPGLTFSFSPAEGYRGLVKDRPTVVILASGSDFVTGMNRGRVDMATPYLRDILGSSASTACVSSPSDPLSARAIRSTPRATRPNDNSVSSPDHFDAGWEREIRPMMGEGRAMQDLLRRHSPDVRWPHAELRTKEIAEMG